MALDQTLLVQFHDFREVHLLAAARTCWSSRLRSFHPPS
jgi:hypothetical protein